MAERQEHISRDGRAAEALPPVRGRPVAANDNVPPVRHVVGKLALAAGIFAATIGFALWWVG